jgi:hypothetical protein
MIVFSHKKMLAEQFFIEQIPLNTPEDDGKWWSFLSFPFENWNILKINKLTWLRDGWDSVYLGFNSSFRFRFVSQFWYKTIPLEYVPFWHYVISKASLPSIEDMSNKNFIKRDIL